MVSQLNTRQSTSVPESIDTADMLLSARRRFVSDRLVTTESGEETILIPLTAPVVQDTSTTSSRVSPQPTSETPKAFGVREDVRWALAKLSEPLRDVVELGVFQDLPYAEVAEILGIPVGTVKSRMHNALKELKEIFDEQGS